MVCSIVSHLQLFCKGMLECLEEMLRRPKWKLELEWRIFCEGICKILCSNLVCMKLKDVMEVLPMFMLENFVDRFVFIWGCEQCSKTTNQISPESHYYL